MEEGTHILDVNVDDVGQDGVREMHEIAFTGTGMKVNSFILNNPPRRSSPITRLQNTLASSLWSLQNVVSTVEIYSIMVD